MTSQEQMFLTSELLTGNLHVPETTTPSNIVERFEDFSSSSCRHETLVEELKHILTVKDV